MGAGPLQRQVGRPSGWEGLAREFPAVELQETPEPHQDGLPCLALPVAEWESQNFNFYEMDGRLDALAERDGGPFAVDVLGEPGELPRAVGEILTRCQR